MIASDRFGLGQLLIPPDEIAPGLPQRVGNQNVGLSPGRRYFIRLAYCFRLVFQRRRLRAKDFFGPQQLQVIGPHEQRKIGKTSHVIRIVEFVSHDDVTKSQRQRRRGAGPHDDGVVAL